MRPIAIAAMAGFSALSAASTANADLAISSKATHNVSCVGGVCTATGQKAVLNASDLATMLASGDVTVTSGSLARDIEIDTPLNWTSSHLLTLDAFRSLAVSRPVVVVGGGGLTILTNDGGAGGDYRFFDKGHVEFQNVESHLTINGNFYVLSKNLKKLAQQIGRRRPFNALAKAYNANKDGTYVAAVLPSSGTIFEGLGNTISNLHTKGFPLFNTINGTVRDLKIVSAEVDGVDGEDFIGILAANPSGNALHCSVDGTLAVGDGITAGGLVGILNGGMISDCSSAVVVQGGDNSTVGGLLGINNNGDVEQSFATGAVSAGDGSNVGGLGGANSSATDIENSYATGSVTGGNSASIGGLLGANLVQGNSIRDLESNYATGFLSGGTGATIGGLIGNDSGTDNAFKNNYWNLETSGVTNPHQGAGNVPDDPGIAGLTDAQLKSGLPAGFDKKIWRQKANTNNSYPYLIANPPQ